MKKKSLLPIVVFGVFLLFGNSIKAFAGTELSPFQPNINQLDVVKNILNSVNDRVQKVLSKPLDNDVPGPSLKDAINRLEAIIEQLISVDDKVFSIVEEVLGVDPSSFHLRSEIVLALENVRDAAQSIVDSLDALPVGEMPHEFIWAVGDVRESAQDIADNTQSYIYLFSDYSIDCSNITIRSDCEANPLCVWVFSGDPADLGQCEDTP
jgi:hypothetical protein